MKDKSTKKFFYLAFIIVLVFTGSVLFYFFDINKGLWWDEAVYLGLAKNIYEGKGYFINSNQENFRPPLFPFLIASLWSVFGVSELLIRIILPVFAISSIVLIYFFAKRLYDEEVGFWAALILATLHMFLFYSLKILTESIFIFISLSAIFLYYIAIEKNRKYFLPAGILMGLSFLTRYPGLILPIFYLVYPISTKERSSFFKDRFFWLGIVCFLLILTPWFYLSQKNFGSPIGALLVEGGTVTQEFYLGEWYYYFSHWFEMFGLVGIFVVPGVLFSLLNLGKKKYSFILVLVSLSLIFFMIIPRKELRYMIHYLPFYVILMSVGIADLRKWLNSKRIIPLIVILFCVINFLAGIQMIFYDQIGGKSLVDAGNLLSKIAPENTTIMTQNMPVIYYTAGRNIVYFPESSKDLMNVTSNSNVSFIVLDTREPTYPDYVWVKDGLYKKPSPIIENFTFVKSFKEGNETFVWVYGTKK